jgi:hypothetical protein
VLWDSNWSVRCGTRCRVVARMQKRDQDDREAVLSRKHISGESLGARAAGVCGLDSVAERRHTLPGSTETPSAYA